MDTKLKKRNLFVSFTLFFIGVSLLLVNGVQIADRLLSRYQWNTDSFLELMEQDYQNTESFRSYMQGRLSDFLAMASGTNMSTAQAKRYHEAICENKNLCYVIRHDGKELYSNLDGISWDQNRKTLPEGYNFRLHFDGKKVSIQKDGENLDIYGDGYYRGNPQWYVPGYQNFAADTDIQKVEVIMFAAKEPVAYSYVRYRGGGYTQTENLLYDIAENVRENHRMMHSGFLGLAAGIVLLAISFFLWKEKRAADVKIGKFTSKIWFEGKCAVMLFLIIGLHTVIEDGSSVYYGDVIQSYDQTHWLYTDDLGTAWSFGESDGTTAENSFLTETTLEQVQEWKDELELETAYVQSGEAFSGWETKFTGAFYRIESALAAHPGFLLIFFWLLYLFWIDLFKNRGHFWDGLIQKAVQQARTKDLKQPFAVRQIHRFLLMAVVSGLSVIAVLIFMILYRKGFLNQFETILSICLILAVFAAACTRCLAWTKQEAVDLDFLADHIRAVQAGDYQEPENQPLNSALKPLFDSLSQIRQGMEQAVGEQLKSERMKVELVANVSHDLKTPLTSIVSYIAFLKQETELPEHVRDYIRILDEKAERLQQIVQDVFAVSKAVSGQLPVELEKLDFGKLLRQTLADMDAQIQASSVSIKAEIPAESMQITADGARLYRVFQNLIQNALKYSLDGSRVFVELKKEGDQAVASVKNISSQELQAGTDFTERFLRGDKSRTDGGAGLGLSIAKSFTEACGGTFTLVTDADLFVVRVGFRTE